MTRKYFYLDGQNTMINCDLVYSINKELDYESRPIIRFYSSASDWSQQHWLFKTEEERDRVYNSIHEFTIEF